MSSDTETPATSEAPSESGSTQPTTPSSALPNQQVSVIKTQNSSHHNRTITKPAVPIIPATPKAGANSAQNHKALNSTDTAKALQQNAVPPAANVDEKSASNGKQSGTSVDQTEDNSEMPSLSLPRAPPKSWADLVRTQASQRNEADITSNVNGSSTNGAGIPKSGSLGQVLQSFSVLNDFKISFLEPRGLVNIGNLCYMNSVGRLAGGFCFPIFTNLNVARFYKC